MTDPHGAMSAGQGAVSFSEAVSFAEGAASYLHKVYEEQHGYEWVNGRMRALRALAGLVARITEAVATDERALTLTDPSARASEQQYAEEEIIQAAVSIAAGFQPEGEDR